jgi:hypothetical protein
VYELYEIDVVAKRLKPNMKKINVHYYVSHTHTQPHNYNEYLDGTSKKNELFKSVELINKI